MPKYKVLIPFEPVIFESVSQTHITELAESFSLSGINVRKSKESIYKAKLTVEAENYHQATLLAVGRVEELLNLFATWNDGFRLIISSVETKKIQDEAETKSIIKEEGREGSKTITLIETAELREYFSTVKTKHNYELEANALNWRDKWPDWLRMALQLNYLAVISHDLALSLILRCSALEKLTGGILEKPKTILKVVFSNKAKKKKELLNNIKKIFSCYGLNNKEVKRLEERIQETQVEGNVSRITEALNKCKVEADPKNVKLVLSQRGTEIHNRKSSSSNELRKASSFAEEWVRKALHFILNNCLIGFKCPPLE